jgi:REP element-mobilizing transposase RayT
LPVALAETPYYHITSRCVRRAFLCGEDAYSGRNYDHRRQWIADRLRLLSSLFAIDLCAYAVMSNHYHLVVRLCPEQLDGLTEREVIQRWCSLFRGPVLIQRLLAGEPLSAAERQTVSDIAGVWRQKLGSISWFMRCLNQPIAWQANREDQCRGKFWESRFTSQALKTDAALVACLAYVDLNPVRAAMAATPETSDYTSVQARLVGRFDLAAAIARQVQQGELRSFEQSLKPLLPFADPQTDTITDSLPLTFPDYLSLLDWTGRAIRNDRRGAIDAHLPPILERLAVTPQQWLVDATQFEVIHRRRFLGAPPWLKSG